MLVQDGFLCVVVGDVEVHERWLPLWFCCCCCGLRGVVKGAKLHERWLLFSVVVGFVVDIVA
jgi:hypothetical protein